MRFWCLILCLFSVTLYAQRNLRDSSRNTVIFAPGYQFNLTAGDLADRWGFNNEVGLKLGVKLKSNLTLDMDGGFIFGNKLKETNIFDNLYTSYGKITSMSGSPAEVLFLMRGATGHVDVGYVFSKLGGINPNSGIWVNVGLGYMMHKIRIETFYDDVPELEGDYRKGYDRLTMGFSTKEFIGYMFQTSRVYLNFYAGVEFIQGFTRNVRSYNFDLGGPDNTNRLDLMTTFKFGWMIPLYKRAPKEIYFD